MDGLDHSGVQRFSEGQVILTVHVFGSGGIYPLRLSGISRNNFADIRKPG